MSQDNLIFNQTFTSGNVDLASKSAFHFFNSELLKMLKCILFLVGLFEVIEAKSNLYYTLYSLTSVHPIV